MPLCAAATKRMHLHVYSTSPANHSLGPSGVVRLCVELRSHHVCGCVSLCCQHLSCGHHRAQGHLGLAAAQPRCIHWHNSNLQGHHTMNCKLNMGTLIIPKRLPLVCGQGSLIGSIFRFPRQRRSLPWTIGTGTLSMCGWTLSGIG
jgi:hypothetical protein